MAQINELLKLLDTIEDNIEQLQITYTTGKNTAVFR